MTPQSPRLTQLRPFPSSMATLGYQNAIRAQRTCILALRLTAHRSHQFSPLMLCPPSNSPSTSLIFNVIAALSTSRISPIPFRDLTLEITIVMLSIGIPPVTATTCLRNHTLNATVTSGRASRSAGVDVATIVVMAHAPGVLISMELGDGGLMITDLAAQALHQLSSRLVD